MLYQVCYNAAAGEAYVREWTEAELENWEESGYRNSYGYFTVVAEVETETEIEVEMESLRGKPVFAVFHDGPSGDTFISKEHGLSGNWRGSKYSPASLVEEYDTREEAAAYLSHYLSIKRACR